MKTNKQTNFQVETKFVSFQIANELNIISPKN